MRERIKQARKARNYSQKALADKIGISDAALSKIESGVNNPARSTLISIASALNVSLKWLETGEGAMEAETESQMFDRIARRYSSTKTFRMVLDVYARLSEEEQRAIERYIEQLAEAFASGENPAYVRLQPEELAEDAKAAERRDPTAG